MSNVLPYMKQIAIWMLLYNTGAQTSALCDDLEGGMEDRLRRRKYMYTMENSHHFRQKSIQHCKSNYPQ